jgi:hypothetical protein
MTKLIFQFDQLIKNLFIVQNQMFDLDIDYDEDLICKLKDDFVNKYRLLMTKDQIDYIFNI